MVNQIILSFIFPFYLELPYWGYQKAFTGLLALDKIEDYFSKQLRRNRVGKLEKHDHGKVLTLGTRDDIATIESTKLNQVFTDSIIFESI